jgi:hypothetical protein
MYFGNSARRSVLWLTVLPMAGEFDQSSSIPVDIMLSGRVGTITGVAMICVSLQLFIRE